MRITGFEGFGVLAFGFEVEIILGVWKTVRWRVWSVRVQGSRVWSFLGFSVCLLGLVGFTVFRFGAWAVGPQSFGVGV